MDIFCHYDKKNLGILKCNSIRYTFYGTCIDGRVRWFCDEECYEKYKKKYFVEEYKGIQIYRYIVNGEERYYPYVGCRYYFTTIEDCKERIDAHSVAILNYNMEE